MTSSIHNTVYYRYQIVTHRQFVARVLESRIVTRSPNRFWDSIVLEGDVYKLAFRFSGNPYQKPETLAMTMCGGHDDWEECKALYEDIKNFG